MSVLGTEDGWYHIPEDEEQHYFYQNVALCTKYKDLPNESHHDNDPRIHCKTCEQKVNKLLAVASSLVGKKLSHKDMIEIINILDTIDLKKGNQGKVKYPENAVAVIGHADGKKTTIEVGKKDKLPPESHKDKNTKNKK